MAEHHHLVHLEAGIFNPRHQFTAPPGITLTQEHHARTRPDQVYERIRDATIICISIVRLDAKALSEEVSPKLKFIQISAVGTDLVDLEVCRRRGIRVSNCWAANAEAVANHAIASYFAARRRVVRVDRYTRDGTWKQRGTMLGDKMEDREGNWPLTCHEETMGVIGYGNVGKRVAEMGKALGMRVLISGRKGEDHPTADGTGVQRTPFDEVIKQSTVLVLSLPKVSDTTNLISTTEFAKMSHQLVLVNVARGGIVNEGALLQALRDRSIYGAATDVFDFEQASAETTPLLADEMIELNLTATPHIAWCADKTAKNLASMSPENVYNYLLGTPSNVVL